MIISFACSCTKKKQITTLSLQYGHNHKAQAFLYDARASLRHFYNDSLTNTMTVCMMT